MTETCITVKRQIMFFLRQEKSTIIYHFHLYEEFKTDKDPHKSSTISTFRQL